MYHNCLPEKLVFITFCVLSQHSFSLCSLLSIIRSSSIVSIKQPWPSFPSFPTCRHIQFFSIKAAIYTRSLLIDEELLHWSFLDTDTSLYQKVFVTFNKNSYFITPISIRLQKQFPRETAQLLESSISVAMVLI